LNSTDYTYRPTGARTEAAAPAWHWTDYAGILLARIWIILTVLVLVVGVSVLRTWHQVPLYRSSARILVEESLPKVLNVDDLLSGGARNLEYFNTQVLALSSRSMMAAALKQKGLGANPRFVPQSLDEAGNGAVRQRPANGVRWTP